MPFTLAHPAAAVPLYRKFGRYGVLSALVIGSMTPDMHSLVPFVGREESHSLPGLFWFCLPVGLLCYLAFHLLLKLPIFCLLPLSVASRLAPFARPSRLLPEVPWTGVGISLFAGALTHLAWDALTHGYTFGFHSLDFLVRTVAHPWGEPLAICDLLQAASSLAGVWLLWRWGLAWLKDAPPAEIEIPLADAGRRKGVMIMFLLFGLAAMLSGAEAHPGDGALDLLSRGIASAQVAMLIAIVAYGLVWHGTRSRIP